MGKELVARALHAGSPRRDRAFVKASCAALASAELESELFGFERGAFPGAHQARPGKFEQAHRGTIFLDEVGELSLPTQAKLLHVLQERQCARLGSRTDIGIDVRVLAATTKNLSELVARKEFREDLYHRLNVIRVHVPALRARRQEISLLTEYFLARDARLYRRPRPRLAPATLERFMTYPWPGNVRELENIVTGIVLLGSDGWVAHELKARGQTLVGSPITAPPPAEAPMLFEAAVAADSRPREEWTEDISLTDVVERVAKAAEREVMHRTLDRVHWHRMEAARHLKISYRTLLRKIEEHGLDAAIDAPSTDITPGAR